MPSSMFHLPDEVVMLMLRMLDDMDLFALTRVSKRFKRLAKDQIVWQQLYLKRWGARITTPDFHGAYLKLAKSEKYSFRLYEVGVAHSVARIRDQVFVGRDNSTIIKFRVPTGEVLATTYAHGGKVSSLAPSPCSTMLASGGDDFHVMLWNAADLREVSMMETHSSATTCVKWVDNTRLLVSTSSLDAAHMIKIYDVNTKEVIGALAGGHRAAVRSIALNNHIVVSGGDDKELICWDLRVNVPVARCRGHVQGITCCDVRDDGTWAVTSSLDRTVKEWDMRKSRELRSHEAHSEAVRCVSGDENKVISGSDDQTIKEANRHTRDWRTIAGHTGSIRCLTVNDREIVSGSLDGTVRLWTVYYPM